MRVPGVAPLGLPLEVRERELLIAVMTAAQLPSSRADVLKCVKTPEMHDWDFADRPSQSYPRRDRGRRRFVANHMIAPRGQMVQPKGQLGGTNGPGNDEDPAAVSNHWSALRKITSYAFGLARSGSLKRCVVFLSRSIRHWSIAPRWIEFIEHFGTRARLGPPPIELVRKSLATYFLYGLPPRRTLDLLRAHFDIALKVLRRERLEQLWSGETFELATIAGKKNTYRVVMRRADQSGARHEGEITFALFAENDYDALCRTTIIFAHDADGQPTVAVGSTQGSSQPGAKPAIIAATRDLHGLRPKDALFLIVKGLAHRLGASEFYAVGNDDHVINRRRASKRRRMWTDLDGYWVDRGGVVGGPFGYTFTVEDLSVSPASTKRDQVKLAFWNIGLTQI